MASKLARSYITSRKLICDLHHLTGTSFSDFVYTSILDADIAMLVVQTYENDNCEFTFSPHFTHQHIFQIANSVRTRVACKSHRAEAVRIPQKHGLE